MKPQSNSHVERDRFLSEDPIGLAGGINPYVFAGNDPVNNSDPSGLCKIRFSAITAFGNTTYAPFYEGSDCFDSYRGEWGAQPTNGSYPTIGPLSPGVPRGGAKPNPLVEGAKAAGRKVLACSEELGDFALAATGTASFHAAASVGANLGRQWLSANMKIFMEQGVNRAVENKAMNYGGRATLQFANAVGGLGGSAALGYVDASATMRSGVLNADFVLGALPYIGAAYTGWKAAKCLYNQ